ncbi:hypothetical protein Tco_1039979 [Tanacetum coccineum]
MVRGRGIEWVMGGSEDGWIVGCGRVCGWGWLVGWGIGMELLSVVEDNDRSSCAFCRGKIETMCTKRIAHCVTKCEWTMRDRAIGLWRCALGNVILWWSCKELDGWLGHDVNRQERQVMKRVKRCDVEQCVRDRWQKVKMAWVGGHVGDKKRPSSEEYVKLSSRRVFNDWGNFVASLDHGVKWHGVVKCKSSDDDGRHWRDMDFEGIDEDKGWEGEATMRMSGWKEHKMCEVGSWAWGVNGVGYDVALTWELVEDQLGMWGWVVHGDGNSGVWGVVLWLMRGLVMNKGALGRMEGIMMGRFEGCGGEDREALGNEGWGVLWHVEVGIGWVGGGVVSWCGVHFGGGVEIGGRLSWGGGDGGDVGGGCVVIEGGGECMRDREFDVWDVRGCDDGGNQGWWPSWVSAVCDSTNNALGRGGGLEAVGVPGCDGIMEIGA